MENLLNRNPLEDVLFVVLLYKNENFNVRAPYDIEIMGKKMWEWVALSGAGAKIKTTPCTAECDIISLVKPFVKDEKYTIVLYSDNPLITKSNILEIMEYFKNKGLNVLKLKRGFVFNSKHLKNCDSVLAPTNPIFDGEEFDAVDNFEMVAKVSDRLRRNILNFHMNNGVYIADIDSTYIDADVIIEKGVRIAQNNTIKGESYIGENTVLEPNNVVINSIISNDVVLRGAYISNSRIAENSIVGPFESIINRNE